MSSKNQMRSKKDLGKLIKNDVDDFWNDCMVAENSLQSSKMNTNENVEQYITFNDTQNKRLKKNPPTEMNKKLETPQKPESYEPMSSAPNMTKSNGIKNLVDKYNFEHLWSPDEVEAKQQEEQRKKKSMERCFILYERGKIKNEVNRIMYHKNEELKIQGELQNCTWKPQLNKVSKKLDDNIKLLTKDTKIYNRAMTWKFKNNQKISRSKSVIQSEMLEYTYKPIVNPNPNLTYVFNENKTIFKDYSNRSFVVRYEKARDEEVYKQNKIQPDLSKQLKDKWNRSSLNRSSSMRERDTMIYKQTLHNDLLAFEYADSEK